MGVPAALGTLLALLAPLAAAADAPLGVVTSVQPLGFIAREVAGERADVAVLVPPGATPHAFEPRPSDVARLARAGVFLRVGGGLDGWTTRLLAAAAPPPASLAVAELPGLPEAGRPHVWLDPLAVRDVIVPAIAALLARVDPAGADAYRAHSADFAARLTALDAEIRALLAPLPQRGFVAFHAAWGGFAARYALREVGVVEAFPGEEPSPRHLVDLVRAARAAGVRVILVEPQLDPRTARNVAAEFDGRTLLVDPLGDPADPERASYEALLRFDARAFARALGATP